MTIQDLPGTLTVVELSLAPDPQASSEPAAQPVPWAAAVLGLYLSGVVIAEPALAIVQKQAVRSQQDADVQIRPAIVI